MPKINVTVPHDSEPESTLEKVQPGLEKTVKDFQGRDLETSFEGTAGNFSFKSMAFTIKGTISVDNDHVSVDVDLPFAAMMFKDKAEHVLKKNITRALEA